MRAITQVDGSAPRTASSGARVLPACGTEDDLRTVPDTGTVSPGFATTSQATAPRGAVCVSPATPALRSIPYTGNAYTSDQEYIDFRANNRKSDYQATPVSGTSFCRDFPYDAGSPGT
jgi:hypothetical protein